MVERATQLIMLDASLGCRSQDLLQKLVPSGCTTPAFAMMLQACHEQLSCADEQGVRIWNNTRRTDNKAYHMHATAASFHAQMHELLGRGKKLAIVSNICKKAKALHCEIAFAYPHLKVLLLTSESGQEDKLADCNVKWLEYDVLIYSPTIGAGVDFNPPSGPHFDAVFAWGGSGSNPAREFLQMVGRVRKVKDREVHMHLSGRARDVISTVTRESILEEIDHSWDTANHNSQLDPAMRQLQPHLPGDEKPHDIGRRGAFKFHEPIYLDLYLHNRLEEARSREGWFDDFIRHAIADNLDSEQGGCIIEVSADHLDKETKLAVNKARLESAEQQAQQECELMARDTFRSNSEAAASQQRTQAQQGTERDKRMAKKHFIIQTYNLQAVQMVVDTDVLSESLRHGAEQQDQSPQPGFDTSICSVHEEGPVYVAREAEHSVDDTSLAQIQQLPQSKWAASVVVGPGSAADGAADQPDPSATAGRAHAATLADFIRNHGDFTSQFKLFCKANGLVAELHQLWVNKIATCPRELHIQLQEYEDFECSRLLKGLLRVMGFTQECPVSRQPAQVPSASAADRVNQMFQWEDGGDLCCMDSVDTDIVERSCSEPDACDWLDRNAQKILTRFRCKIERPRQVADVVRTVRAALKTVGLTLSTGNKRQVPREDGPPRTVTSWTLVSPQRDSLLELAYSDSKRFRPHWACSSGWNVAASLDILQPAFRWQSLTGVNRPEHWQRCVSPVDSQSSSSDSKTEPRGAKKRKR